MDLAPVGSTDSRPGTPSREGVLRFHVQEVAGPEDPSNAGRLAAQVLAEAGAVFAHRGDAEGIATGVARLVAARLGDWCLVARLGPGAPEVPTILVVRPEVGMLDRPGRWEVSPTEGIGSIPGPASGSWGGPDTLVLVGPEGRIDLPASAFGVLPLGSGRLRWGTLVVARGPAGASFGDPDRRLLETLAARTTAALERAELARSASRASRARDTVVDVVAHDLATPLNSVELLLDRIASVDVAPTARARIEGHVAAARRSLDQVRRLVNDLGDIRDIEQGLFTARLTTQSVCEILSSALSQAEPTARAAGITVRLVSDACPIRVMADPQRVVQLLGHLLDNAIRVTPRGGTVVVTPARAGDRAEVSVEDEGPGIPPHLLPHLFDRFARARGHDGGRRGLGLMIAQKIARAHGEPLRVETGARDGSRFTFSLALAEPVARAATTRESGVSGAGPPHPPPGRGVP